ncbi:protein CC2D2B-like [Acipenser ruthenus]|uniref:protein CC2D2B-like n=1 Tax=Acipenser ruthenus TaxID=7906 RepID=UPI0027425A41|nr:protein CC2D2B-like [Acipenser ruthenus]
MEVLSSDFFKMMPAEYVDIEEKFEEEAKFLFVPGSSPVSFSEKMPPNVKPRFLQDEGLYVRERPEVSRKIWNKMENRLFKQEKGNHWFGEDGNLIALSDPIRQSWSNKLDFLFDERDPAIKTVYKKAIKSKLERSVICDLENSGLVCQLDLNISSLVFTHHPLFSREHVLAVRLIQLYDHYLCRQQKNLTHLLSEKLRALKHIARSTETNLNDSSHRVKDFKKQIRETRKILEDERQADISLFKNIMMTWKQIKSLRKTQGYANTKVKLQVQRLVGEKVTEKVSAQKYAKEQDPLNKDKLTDKQKTEECTKNTEITELYMCCDLEEKQESQVSQTHQESEEPALVPVLTMNRKATPTEKCPLGEQRRRNEIQKTRFLLKIFYNEKQVSCSKISFLGSDFTVEFQQIFSIQIMYLPESIRLEICENIGRNSNILANVYVPIPDGNVLSGNAILDQAEFSSDQIVMTNHEGVGSNIPCSSEEDSTVGPCLLTSGKLFYSVSWAVDKNGITLGPAVPQPKQSANGVLKNVDPWLSNKQKLVEWAKEAQIDPNDPKNTDLVQLMMYASKTDRQVAAEHFRLEQFQEEFNFVTDEEFESSKRFRLLQLRNSEVSEFCGFKQIPLYDREIPDSIFEEYELQLQLPLKITDEDPITSQRIWSVNYVRKVLNLARKRLLKVKCRYKLSDIVAEYEQVDTVTQLNLAIFKHKHRLKPTRKERKSVPAQVLSDGDVKLLVTITRAYNIPARRHSLTRGTSIYGSACSLARISSSKHMLRMCTSEDDNDQVPIQPFVEVEFQQSVDRTSTATGSQPCWNEELRLDFKSMGGDYSYSGLSKVKDKIFINVFDEIAVDVQESHCVQGCGVQTYMGRQWLGSIALPFSSVLQQSKVSGTFRLNTPLISLGYTWKKEDMLPDAQDNYLSQTESCFLSIFVTVDPQISTIETDTEKESPQKPMWLFATNEDEKLLEVAYTYEKHCKTMHPRRRLLTAVIDTEGRKVLATRYIKALPPPQELLQANSEGVQVTFDLVARFVSLIPLLPYTVDVGDDWEMWFTSEQCIDFAVGTKAGLAVLLCNYFLYMGKKTWLLLGTSVLEGETAYVVTQENRDYVLWNPRTGECYEQFDIFCPLQTADCLISEHNIWFNLQQHNSLMNVNFEISKEAFWKPLFPTDFPSSVPLTLQPSEISYRPTDTRFVEQLESRIEKTLKMKLMEWRSHHPTRWHRQCIVMFRHILPRLEYNPGGAVLEEQVLELETVLKEYKVTGFPVQMPYMDMKTVIETIHSTGIHNTEIPGTEFAIAVYIHPYPNNILSLWIYLASLVHHQ